MANCCSLEWFLIFGPRGLHSNKRDRFNSNRGDGLKGNGMARTDRILMNPGNLDFDLSNRGSNSGKLLADTGWKSFKRKGQRGGASQGLAQVDRRDNSWSNPSDKLSTSKY
jgi:hypothetical protein